MTTKMRKILALVIALVMVAGMLPATAQAQENGPDGYTAAPIAAMDAVVLSTTTGPAIEVTGVESAEWSWGFRGPCCCFDDELGYWIEAEAVFTLALEYLDGLDSIRITSITGIPPLYYDGYWYDAWFEYDNGWFLRLEIGFWDLTAEEFEYFYDDILSLSLVTDYNDLDFPLELEIPPLTEGVSIAVDGPGQYTWNASFSYYHGLLNAVTFPVVLTDGFYPDAWGMYYNGNYYGSLMIQGFPANVVEWHAGLWNCSCCGPGVTIEFEYSGIPQTVEWDLRLVLDVGVGAPIQSNEFTLTVDVSPLPVVALVSPPNWYTVDFGYVHVGYSPITPRTVTVRNISPAPLADNLYVSLQDLYGYGGGFVLSAGAGTTLSGTNVVIPAGLAPNATATFTVAPRNNLDSGWYYAVVAISFYADLDIDFDCCCDIYYYFYVGDVEQVFFVDFYVLPAFSIDYPSSFDENDIGIAGISATMSVTPSQSVGPGQRVAVTVTFDGVPEVYGGLSLILLYNTHYFISGGWPVVVAGQPIDDVVLDFYMGWGDLELTLEFFFHEMDDSYIPYIMEDLDFWIYHMEIFTEYYLVVSTDGNDVPHWYQWITQAQMNALVSAINEVRSVWQAFYDGEDITLSQALNAMNTVISIEAALYGQIQYGNVHDLGPIIVNGVSVNLAEARSYDGVTVNVAHNVTSVTVNVGSPWAEHDDLFINGEPAEFGVNQTISLGAAGTVTTITLRVELDMYCPYCCGYDVYAIYTIRVSRAAAPVQQPDNGQQPGHTPDPGPGPGPGPGAPAPAPAPAPDVDDPAPGPGPEVNEEIAIGEEELIYLVEQDEDFVIEQEGVTLVIPNEILAAIFDAENPEDITVEFNVSPVSDADFEAGHLLTVEVNISVGDEVIEVTATPFTVSVSLEDFDLGDVNTYRIIAITEDGAIIGGRLDPETGLFTFETQITGGFTISYVEDLIRLSLSLDSPVIYDLAANAPTQQMDVLPVIQDGRTLIPIRFIAETLGAEVDWTPATADTPLTIHVALDGQILTFAIGEITPGLAALGMDVPAQIMDGRTMVPLRFISEFFGAIVTWDAETRGIEIVK